MQKQSSMWRPELQVFMSTQGFGSPAFTISAPSGDAGFFFAQYAAGGDFDGVVVSGPNEISAQGLKCYWDPQIWKSIFFRERRL